MDKVSKDGEEETRGNEAPVGYGAALSAKQEISNSSLQKTGRTMSFAREQEAGDKNVLGSNKKMIDNHASQQAAENDISAVAGGKYTGETPVSSADQSYMLFRPVEIRQHRIMDNRDSNTPQRWK